MNRKRKNIIPKSKNRRPASRQSEEELSRDILSRMEIPFPRLKAESWAELEKKMESGNTVHQSDRGRSDNGHSDNSRSDSVQSTVDPSIVSLKKSHPLLLVAASLAL